MEVSSDARQNLYQSQWWTRLAAFTERQEVSDTLQFVVISREKALTRNGRQTKVVRTFIQNSKVATNSVGKTLAFLVRGFTPIKSEGLINSPR